MTPTMPLHRPAVPPRHRQAWVLVTAAAAALVAGLLAAGGYGAAALAALGGLGLLALGMVLPLDATRAILLLALLLVPDVASGASLGLLVRWSAGLTWSNFVLPALALPLLAGAWLAGGQVMPHRWPGLARGLLWLLAWGLLTLLVAWSGGGLAPSAAATVLAHWIKLVMFLGLGVALAGGGAAWRRRAGRLLVLAVAGNAAMGLAQAAGWAPVFSPLAQATTGTAARASGLFYDANMYGMLAAWALLWLLSRRRLGGWGWLLTLAVAGNLVAAGSRAGYLALGVGLAVLLVARRRPALLRAAALVALAGLLFPLRSGQRIAAAVRTVAAEWSGGVAAAAPRDPATEQRLDSMAQAWRQIERHPLLGLGFGRALYVGVPALGTGPAQPAAPFQGAQNLWLTVLAETGPLGLALLCLAVAAPLRRLRAAARAPDPGQLALLAGFVGLLAGCLTNEALWNTRILALAVLLTAGLGWGAPAREAA